MSIASLPGSRIALAVLAMSVALAGAPALAGPPRAKPARATAKKVERKVVKVGKAHIEAATAVKKATGKGGTLPSGQGSVQQNEPDEIAFTLSANTPNVPYRGRLIGHYPREWRTEGDSLGPGGEIWLSQNQVPNLSYAIAQIHVEAGHDYEVTLCTGGGTSEMVRATVGDVTHTFESGNDDCDMTLVLKPEKTGKTDIKIAFANEPTEHGANAFSVVAVEVVRR